MIPGHGSLASGHSSHHLSPSRYPRISEGPFFGLSPFSWLSGLFCLWGTQKHPFPFPPPHLQQFFFFFFGCNAFHPAPLTAPRNLLVFFWVAYCGVFLSPIFVADSSSLFSLFFRMYFELCPPHVPTSVPQVKRSLGFRRDFFFFFF